MAANTRDKRFSFLQLLQQPGHFAPNPDGTIGDADRAMLLHLYSGLTLDSGASGDCDLLLESGAGSILLQDGSSLLLEDCVVVTITRIPSGAKKGHRLGGTNIRRSRHFGKR